jgi:hypothetical protein
MTNALQSRQPVLIQKGKNMVVRLGSDNHKVIDQGFFHDSDLDFQTRGVLGRSEAPRLGHGMGGDRPPGPGRSGARA